MIKRIERKNYLDKLIAKKWNGRIKIIAGLRRAGNSFLLFELFREHLISSGGEAREYHHPCSRFH